MRFSVGLGSADSSRSTTSTNCYTNSPRSAAWSPTRNRAPNVLRDTSDDYLGFLARAVGAECIVSGDADLTETSLEPRAIAPREAVGRLRLGNR